MKESDIQSDIMIALGEHKDVAWVYVTSAGSFRVRGGYVTVGVKGMPDILGQMRNGKIFGIEVKKPKERPKPDQMEFLDLISRNKGLSGWCTDVLGAIEIIEAC
jgi:hypothetical protein